MRFAIYALAILVAGMAAWVCCGGVFSTWALHRAVQAGDTARIKQLAEHGVNLDSGFLSSKTPLYIALEKENREVYELLLEAGANPNIVFSRGLSVMHKSASLPDAWWLRKAIDHGGDVDLVNKGGRLTTNATPIVFAIFSESPACLDVLINAKADLDRQNSSGENALLCAIHMSRYDFVLRLFEGGADYELKTAIEMSFLDEFRRRHDGLLLSDEQKVYREKVKKWLSDRKAL